MRWVRVVWREKEERSVWLVGEVVVGREGVARGKGVEERTGRRFVLVVAVVELPAVLLVIDEPFSPVVGLMGLSTTIISSDDMMSKRKSSTRIESITRLYVPGEIPPRLSNDPQAWQGNVTVVSSRAAPRPEKTVDLLLC